ncbi:hypothetical protein C8Q80DRAFT_1119397 [Daedaleopsis nitida]|nr:hypothetical protein C8Q80DRAFT_1119397 [Daedaleopsis nitida]
MMNTADAHNQAVLIAVNSMADERIASNFTWFNSAVHSRQNVKTLVDLVQDFPEKPRTQPTVRWTDMDQHVFKRREKALDGQSDDKFFENWPAEEQNAREAAEELREEREMSDEVFWIYSDVNISSAMLKRLLCNKDMMNVDRVGGAGRRTGKRDSQDHQREGEGHESENAAKADWDF